MYFQEVIQALNTFWEKRGCILWQPYHTEVGAGTSNPATFLRVLGPEPWWVAYPEPSTRPTDGRYGENPNRLQHYYQYQVILKPSPPDVQDLFLQSLEALGLDLRRHDFRFVEDNWQSPSLGAWGLGWEAWLDGMEILQFTYFQECGGVKLDVRACELTYGVERIAMYLQGVESVYDLKWAPCGLTYGDIFHHQEVEFCKYNFELADTAKLFQIFDLWESEAQRLLDSEVVLPAYDHCLRLSHLFNVLDARGALSVTERGRFLLRCRAIAERCAKSFLSQRETLGFPLTRYPVPGENGKTSAPILVHRDASAKVDTLLIEIGCEELPPADLRSALDQLSEITPRVFNEFGIAHGDIHVYGTPRRLALLIDNVASSQQDVVKEVRGPKKTAAINAQGEWSIAARRFAEGHGASVSDIYFQQQDKNEYCFLRVEVKGKHLADVISDIVGRLIKGLAFAKSMGWEDTTVTFSRPIRWLLVLHGKTPLPVVWNLRERNGDPPARQLISGTVSYGHRRLCPGPVTVPSASNYLSTLRTRMVIADRRERMQALREGIARCSEELGVHPEEDDELLDEVCDLVELPEPIVCRIPDEALDLPEPILITPMKVHQRYIPLRETDGKLSPWFIAVANGQHDKEGRQTIREGNQRVLTARLRDAKYFWETDTRTPLEVFAQKLSRVMFHQELGTVADKVQRLKNLYHRLNKHLPETNENDMVRLLDLMKADLTTQMVFEFDSLEGVVGMLYAQKEGIPEHIAKAILEHRLPRRAGDALPASALGTVAGLLDRFDTLAGYFGIGVRVKGTSDPYALRRNTLAVLSILRAQQIDVDLAVCFRAAVENYTDKAWDTDKVVDSILGFLGDRMATLARDEGYPYDYVAAALTAHPTRPIWFWKCLDALRRRESADIQELAEQAKRMQRICKEPAEHVDEKLLHEHDQALHVLTTGARSALLQQVEQGDFEGALQTVLSWTPIISAYFEKVLVNDENESVRRNRHALLRDVLAAMVVPADFTQIEKKDVTTG